MVRNLMMRKWLLVETVAPLQEEDRPRAVELDERGDEDEQRRPKAAPPRRTPDRTRVSE